MAKLAKEQLLPFFHKSLYNGSKRTGGQQRNRYGNYSSAFRSGNEKYTEGTSGRKADRGKPGAPSDGGLILCRNLVKQEQPQMTEELKELQEELLAHYGKGTLFDSC